MSHETRAPGINVDLTIIFLYFEAIHNPWGVRVVLGAELCYKYVVDSAPVLLVLLSKLNSAGFDLHTTSTPLYSETALEPAVQEYILSSHSMTQTCLFTP